MIGIHNSLFFENFGKVLSKYPAVDLKDLFSSGQIQSKRWLMNELEKLGIDLGIVFVCAGWYGSLATFLLESKLNTTKIRSFDIDPSCADIADTFNKSFVMDGWKFKATTLDIMSMNYPTEYVTLRSDGSEVNITEMPNTIINTSCEHIERYTDWFNNIPDGMLIVLQSNNFFGLDEHVNCVKSIDDFISKSPMRDILFSGELDLKKYKRFMIIGYK